MGFTVSPELALGVSAGCSVIPSSAPSLRATSPLVLARSAVVRSVLRGTRKVVYSSGLTLARKKVMDLNFQTGATGSKGTMGDWFTLMVAGHGVKDMVAAKEGPTKKHVLATAATWAGVTALAAYQTFGPTKSMKKEGFYAALTVGTANTGLCLLAAKDM